MTEILEILKYTLPSLIIFGAVWFVLHSMIKNEQKRNHFESVAKNQRITTPVRLQAYERMTILLERISPEALIMRVNDPSLTAKQFQTELLNNIRMEFEHNVAQQVYISNQAWELIKNAKTSVIQLINSTAAKVKPESQSIILSRMILEELMQQEKSPVAIALDYLKTEIRQFF
ncbi:MAG: hypothetical protein A2W99_12160 [Bacteroidetes bacterium GWF2_33_16]|nr:MAG: hypothetical protein A2X00_02115 [Bacteroidetes bacterium GWE2_32_14]OFY06451.1 MAG: hypothetical protein A2W99_12160 [Bacteroidetes bacterium GWF2_33_16]